MFEPKGLPSQRAKRKYTSSEASRRSAQANGKLSSGPRSAAACQAVAMRALKDGCYADTIILEHESKAEYDALVADFIRGTGALTPLECEMAGAAALARWRCKRVIRGDASALRRQIHDAECGEQEARDRRVLALARKFVDNPGDTVTRLRETSEGCLWLINQWTIISNRLETSNLILHNDCLRAIRLLGKTPSELLHDTDVEDWIWMYMAHFPRDKETMIDIEHARKLFDELRPVDVTVEEYDLRLRHWLSRLPAREFALAFMRQTVADALAELFDRYGMLEAEQMARHQMDVGLAQADETVEGARRHRQEQALKKEMLTMLAAVKALRAERLAEAAAGGSAGAAADPNSKAQNNPKLDPADRVNSELDQEVSSEAPPCGNPNGEPAPVVSERVPDEDAAGPSGPDPEPAVAEPEADPPRPRLIDVCDDPPWDQVVRLPAYLAAEFAAADAPPEGDCGSPGDVPAAEPAAAEPALAEPEPAPEQEPAGGRFLESDQAGVAGAESATPRQPQTGASMTPPLPPAPDRRDQTGSDHRPVAAPAPIPQPPPGRGGPAPWGPGPHPRDPRYGPGAHVPPSGWPPPPRGQPPPPPGAGSRFHPRDG
jgi:hypothetical protein